MGILNLTIDSFSDGGRFRTPAEAIDAARRMIDDGADLIDVGAESSRPGADPVPEALEWQRLEPVLTALAPLDCPVSVDTRRPAVMARAIAAGAAVINDIGGFADPAAIAAVAAADVGLVVMHMQGEPQTMQQAPSYGDVVAEVAGFLAGRCRALAEAGVAPARLCVDPGFGFGKNLSHNLALLAALDRLGVEAAAAVSGAVPVPVLAGLSRKSMLGRLTGRPVDRRLGASVAAALVAVARGAAIVRVHDVADTVDALAVWRAATAGADADSPPVGPGSAGPASRHGRASRAASAT
ncbi:MAG: dihydropteroate synthase [Lautropia sp.]